MTAPTTPPQPPEPSPFTSPAVLGLSLHQLRDWETRAARHVVCPKPDHQAWEDTEIDVRRVVL